MLDEKGYTLQTVVITSILVLATAGISVLVVRILNGESNELDDEIDAPAITLD